MTNPMRDPHKRVIDYMRISVTDRCNLRCVYCMPAAGVKLIEHTSILSYEEIIRIVHIAATLGVKKIRLTGGEPLTRRNIKHLISAISLTEGIEDLSLTTNGLLLRDFAKPLAEAGLNRVNVSLDSLKPERYREITRGGSLEEVFAGIRIAEEAKLVPIKFNMVPIKGFNDDEIEDFARLTLSAPHQVRFIEFMPIGAQDLWSTDRCVPTDEIRDRVNAIGQLIPVKVRSSGPARYYRFDGAPGVIGFISPLTHHFCSSCNRLRLTADGKLRPCLFSETEIDLRAALRSGADDAELERLLRLAVAVKPQGHSLSSQPLPSRRRPMSRIGG